MEAAVAGASKLPIFQDENQNFMLMQTRWQSVLNRWLGIPLSSGILLSDVVLASGANTINHLLARTQQGWMLTDINAAVTVYRSAAFNDKTLTLTASGAATVSLYVF